MTDGRERARAGVWGVNGAACTAVPDRSCPGATMAHSPLGPWWSVRRPDAGDGGGRCIGHVDELKGTIKVHTPCGLGVGMGFAGPGGCGDTNR